MGWDHTSYRQHTSQSISPLSFSRQGGFWCENECGKGAFKHYHKGQGLRAPQIEDLRILTHLCYLIGLDVGVFTHALVAHAVGIVFCNMIARWKVLESVVLLGYQAPSTHAFSDLAHTLFQKRLKQPTFSHAHSSYTSDAEGHCERKLIVSTSEGI